MGGPGSPAKQASSNIGGASNVVGSYAEGGPVGPSSSVGKFLSKALAMKQGGKVPGTAQEHGNSPKNDTVPAMLSPGEIVVPRSHASDPEKAAAFAKAVSMRMGKKGKK